jgi:acetolactate synthase-1/2/3 large subunit
MADVRTFLRQLLAELDARGSAEGAAAQRGPWLDAIAGYRREWEAFVAPGLVADTTPIHPQRAAHEIGRALPDDAILVSDIGVHHNWLNLYCKPKRPDSLIGSMGFGPMGFGVAGVLGAKLAAPDRPCVAVVGDGSFLMTPHALATAVEYDIPVVWVVWNNYGYVSIRDIQMGMFGGRELATNFQKDRTRQPYSPDFALLAKSFGVPSHTVTHAGEVEDAIRTAVAADTPYLIEVPVDREIRPIGTGSWDLPPLPPPEPDFIRALNAAGLSL